MKLSAKSAREALNMANQYWVDSLDRHGDGDVDLEAFTHMITFRLAQALQEIMEDEMCGAMMEGLSDAREPPPETEPELESRVLH